MKHFLTTVIMASLLITVSAQATPLKFEDCEILPIPKSVGYTFVTTGPQEASFGKNVWVLDGEEWRPLADGFDFFRWNANILYRYFDNSRTEFYYVQRGNEHSADYPDAATPIPASVLMLATGLVSLVGLRRKVR